MRSALGECAQRRRLARGTGASGCPLPAHREAPLFSRRRGFCQSRDVRVRRSRRHRLHDPAAGQPGLAGQDRIPTQAPGRATAARGAALLRQLRVSGAELEEIPAGRGEGRVAPQ